MTETTDALVLDLVGMGSRGASQGLYAEVIRNLAHLRAPRPDDLGKTPSTAAMWCARPTVEGLRVDGDRRRREIFWARARPGECLTSRLSRRPQPAAAG